MKRPKHFLKGSQKVPLAARQTQPSALRFSGVTVIADGDRVNFVVGAVPLSLDMTAEEYAAEAGCLEVIVVERSDPSAGGDRRQHREESHGWLLRPENGSGSTYCAL